MKALTLVFLKAFTVDYDNAQTRQLLVNELTKLQTKLRYVNIHLHWLRQKVQRRSINIHWVSIRKMITDNLTKTLLSVKHNTFVEMTSLEDQKIYLASVKEEEEKKKSL